MASVDESGLSPQARHTEDGVKLEKKGQPYRADWRFGVVNHRGDVWTPETFNTPDAALNYIAAAKAQNPTWDLDRHRVVPVRVTVSISSRKPKS